MKKIALLFGLVLATTTIFAQTKPKSMKELRDSMFTVMKLSDENRQKMHELIAETGKRTKAIKEDATLSDEDKKTKLAASEKERREKQSSLLTPEQEKAWKEFAASMRKPKE